MNPIAWLRQQLRTSPEPPPLPPGVTREVRPDGAIILTAHGGAGGQGGTAENGFRGGDGEPGAGNPPGSGGRGGRMPGEGGRGGLPNSARHRLR